MSIPQVWQKCQRKTKEEEVHFDYGFNSNPIFADLENVQIGGDLGLPRRRDGFLQERHGRGKRTVVSDVPENHVYTLLSQGSVYWNAL